MRGGDGSREHTLAPPLPPLHHQQRREHGPSGGGEHRGDVALACLGDGDDDVEVEQLKPSRASHSGPKTKMKYQKKSTSLFSEISVMILPQVHLRKPCYDFYFL